MRAGRLCVSVVVGALTLTVPAAAQAETIYGLIHPAVPPETLVSFDSATPATTTPIGPITGLQPGDSLAGIDVRPATGELYGVGSASRLYRISRTTAVATQVGSGQFSPPLAGPGVSVGVDFDPVSDVLRVTSNGDQNLRINPDTAGVIADTAINPAGRLPEGLAYNANVPGSTSTTAYAYTFNNNRLNTLGSPGGSPTSPNTGQLIDVGAPGVAPDAGSFALIGLDISPTGSAYLSASVGGMKLYLVNLGSGAATLIGAAAPNLLDIAVAPIAQTIAYDAASYSASEGAGNVTLTLTRSQSLGAAFVHVATSDGSATAGSDYTAVDSPVTFAPGEVSAQVQIPILEDASAESPETFDVTLSSPSGEDASLGSPPAATVTIADNEDVTPPTVALSKLPKQITISRLLHKGLKVTASPSETSALTFTLLGKPLKKPHSARAFSSTLAKVALPLGDGARSAKLKPKRAKLKRVQQRSLQVRVVATDASGNSGSTQKTVRIKRPKR